MKIEIKNVSFSYASQKVLDGVNLTIPDRGVYGLLGRNGAGKTTLMKLITGLLPLDQGEITLGDTSVSDQDSRALIGYLSQKFDFYPRMKVEEVLYYLGALDEIPGGTLKKRVEEVLELVNLSKDRKKRVKALSGGMKRRLGIAQALLNDPAILVVDEPTAGLDPEERIRFRNLFSELGEEKTILLSTHIASDLETTASQLAILEGGRLVFQGATEDLIQAASGNTFETRVLPDELSDFKKKYLVYEQRESSSGFLVRFISYQKPKENFRPVEASLESAYMRILHDKGGF